MADAHINLDSESGNENIITLVRSDWDGSKDPNVRLGEIEVLCPNNPVIEEELLAWLGNAIQTREEIHVPEVVAEGVHASFEDNDCDCPGCRGAVLTSLIIGTLLKEYEDTVSTLPNGIQIHATGPGVPNAEAQIGFGSYFDGE